MLIMGWAALKYSLAWIANPLLISGFVLSRPNGDPRAWRWLVYAALTMMVVRSADSFARFWPLPIFPWLASAVILLIGIERFRSKYRQALSMALRMQTHTAVARPLSGGCGCCDIP